MRGSAGSGTRAFGPQSLARVAATARVRRLLRTPWFWPALLALVITGLRADGAQLWRDEFATWNAATRPLPQLFRLVSGIDAVNAPFYVFMHVWIALFGDSVWAMRAPGILAMTGAAGLTAVLGGRLFSPRAGLLAGLLFALLPSTSRYAQEARSYALATAFALLATVLLVDALPAFTWRRWAGYAAVVAGLGLAHLVALTLLAGHAVAVLLTARAGPDRRLWRWPLALIPALLATMPLVLFGTHQQARQLAWVTRPGLGDVIGLPGSLVQSSAVGGLLLGLAAVGAANRGRRGMTLALSVLLPVAALYASGLFTPLWVPRYLIFTLPFGCVLAATVLADLKPPHALAIVLVAALLGAPDQAAVRRTHESPRSAAVDYAGAARIIGGHDRPGDAIVYSPRVDWRFLDIAMAYHLRQDRPRDALAVRDQRARGDFWVTECPRPAECLAGVDRVWLLVNGRHQDPLRTVTGAKGAALRDGYRVGQVWLVPGITVALLIRPAG